MVNYKQLHHQNQNPILNTASKTSAPLLLRIKGEFRAYGIPPGIFVEFYPKSSTGKSPQVFHGESEHEYFLSMSMFRNSPHGAITYRVRDNGSLQFLDENL